jgi:hypothetical protein
MFERDAYDSTDAIFRPPDTFCSDGKRVKKNRSAHLF